MSGLQVPPSADRWSRGSKFDQLDRSTRIDPYIEEWGGGGWVAFPREFAGGAGRAKQHALEIPAFESHAFVDVRARKSWHRPLKHHGEGCGGHPSDTCWHECHATTPGAQATWTVSL